MLCRMNDVKLSHRWHQNHGHVFKQTYTYRTASLKLINQLRNRHKIHFKKSGFIFFFTADLILFILGNLIFFKNM